MGNKLLVGVEMVDYHVSVAFVTGREDDQLEIFGQLFEALSRIWPDIDPGFQHCPIGKLDRQSHIMIQGQILIAVDQSLVEVEHDGLPVVLYRRKGFASVLSRSLLLCVFYVRQDVQGRRQVVPA